MRRHCRVRSCSSQIFVLFEERERVCVCVCVFLYESCGPRSRRGMGEVDGLAHHAGPRIYSCCNCRCHVSDHDDIISKCFQGRNGRAYLVANVVNVSVGPKEDRHLMTGMHTVADIHCFQCQEVLGWKYEKAFEESQKYKEGKFILEKAKVMKENW